MSSKRVGEISTGEIALLAGAGLLAVYLLTKKSTTPTVITVPSSTASTSNNGLYTSLGSDATSVINTFLNSI